MSKIALVAAAAAGYVLGARAGRERYEQIASQAQRVWSDPRVQQKKDEAQGLAKEKGSQAVGAVSDKVGEAVSDAADRVTGDGGAGGPRG